MVYINSESQKMTILKSKRNKTANKLVLINQIDKNKSEYTIETEQIEYSKSYYTIDLLNILEYLNTPGQYNYYLYSGNELIESGILQFDNFDTNIQSYNIEDKNIIQYNG